MSESRTQKSIRNAKWGVVLQMLTIPINFLVRTVFIRTLGVEMNALNGLMSEVVAILSVAELGFGSAITYHLYKPLAQGDEQAVARMMDMYRRAYRVIAYVLLALGAVAMPFIPRIVTKVDFTPGYIRWIFALFILQTASSYLLSYKRTLLEADQKSYMVTLFSIGSSMAGLVLNVAVLLLFKNYVAFLCVQIALSLTNNFAISLYVDRHYPLLREKKFSAKPEEKKAVFSSIRHLFVGMVSGKITTSTDNVLISLLVGTRQIGLYTNYAMIVNVILGLFRKVSGGLAASLGNLYAMADHARAQTAFCRVEFAFGTAGLVVSWMTYAAVTPFVSLWLGESFLLDEFTFMTVIVNLFFFIAREPLWHMCTVSGLFVIDKYVSILGSTVNLIVSIVLGRAMGMAGIFLGTTCTLLIQIVLKEYFLYRYRLEMRPWSALGRWALRCAALMLGLLLIRSALPLVQMHSALLTLVVNVALSGAFSLAAIFLLYGWNADMRFLLGMVREKIAFK